MKQLLIFLLLVAAITSAANVVAILEIIPKTEDANLTIAEYRHLTDELRAQARKTLSRNYSILTRDNIIALIPPDEKEAECLAEGCAVTIGRAIGAEYVSQGFVGRFEGMLTLTVELYESMTGNLIGSFVTESDNAKGLLETIRKEAPELFKPLSEPKFSELKEFPELKATISENPIPHTTPKPQTSTFIAITLDVLGAAAIGFGVYQRVHANKLYDDYSNMKQNTPVERSAALSKAKDTKSLGNVACIAGGVLLAAGIGVHIWW